MDSLTNEAAKVNFLELIPHQHRSHITNIFLEAIRLGKSKPGEVLAWAMAKCILEHVDAVDRGDTYKGLKFGHLRKVFKDHYKTSLDFAEYCIVWESLPKEAKSKIKAARSATYRQMWYEQRRQQGGGA